MTARGSKAKPSSRKAPPSGTNRADTLGGALERRIARIEFAEGAVTRLRVPVPAPGADAGRDVLTDIDVLSIDVDLRLRVARSSAECKSGRGQSGEPQTLVWLAGFRQLLDLDRVTLVRPSISTRGRELARRLHISTLDEITISQREKANQWLPSRFAHLDGPECGVAETRTDAQLRGLPALPPSLTQFLRADALLAEPAALLAAVEALGDAVAAQGALPEPASTVLAGHALFAIVLAAIQDAGTLDSRTPKELRVAREQELVTSDPTLFSLLDSADDLVRHVLTRVHRSYVDAGAEPIGITAPSLRESIVRPLPYLDDYVDFVERLRSNPTIARDLLQTTELACFEVLLGGDAWKSPAFGHLFTAEHKGLVLVALRCLSSVAGAQVAGYLSALHDLKVFAGQLGVPDRSTAPRQHSGLSTVAESSSTQPMIEGIESP